MTKFYSWATISAAAVLALAAGSADAKRIWVVASSTQVEAMGPGKPPVVTIDAAASDDVFQLDSFAAKLDGLVVTAPDGTAATCANPFTLTLRSSCELTLAQTGTYRVTLASDTINARYTAGGEIKRFRGTAAEMAAQVPADATDVATSHMLSRADTYVSNGKPTAASWQPTGKGLEIVPITAPADFIAGESATFRALLDGKPLAGLAVSVVPGGVRYRGALKDTNLTTDARGEVTVTWPLGQLYWVGASYPPRPPQIEGGPPAGPPPLPEDRQSYSVTFEVLPF